VGVVLHQEAFGMDFGGLEKGRETVFIHDGPVGDTIVPNHWRCKGKNLTLIGRVGQTFGVSYHSCSEDDLRVSTPQVRVRERQVIRMHIVQSAELYSAYLSLD